MAAAEMLRRCRQEHFSQIIDNAQVRHHSSDQTAYYYSAEHVSAPLKYVSSKKAFQVCCAPMPCSQLEGRMFAHTLMACIRPLWMT